MSDTASVKCGPCGCYNPLRLPLADAAAASQRLRHPEPGYACAVDVTNRLFVETGAQDTVLAAEKQSREAWDAIQRDPSGFRVLTGERPTGALHVGHYFGSLQRRKQIQELGVETWLLIADYQALTDRTGGPAIAQSVHEIVLDYLAVGLDVLEEGLAFAHSMIPELNQLLLPFLSLVSVGEIDRNPTVKSEVQALGAGHVSGLMFNYPVHQAADILACRGSIVPGGRDQLPHVEITRKIARRFNRIYTPEEPLFPEPTLLFGEAPLLLGVDGKKMGKSANNAIYIRDDEDSTARLISRAVTDADRFITYEPVARPEVSNLLLLAACSSGRAPEEIATEIGNGGGRALKDLTTEAVNSHFREIRARRREFAEDPRIVETVLRRGEEIVRDQATKTLRAVHELMGLRYLRT